MAWRSMAVLVLLGLCTRSAVAGEGPAGDLADFGRFDRELRAALVAGDAIALAPLVSFPLRVNHPGGAVTSLVNPRALQVQFASVFPPAVRQAIVDSGAADMIHRSSGIGYRDGVAWVDRVGSGEAERYRLLVVNLPGSPTDSPAPRLELVCDAAAHRVVVDSVASVPRYRAWNRPRALTEPPDLEIAGGDAVTEGTTPCTATSWTFRRAGTTYVVAELACVEAGEDGTAIGELRVEGADGQPVASWWCY